MTYHGVKQVLQPFTDRAEIASMVRQANVTTMAPAVRRFMPVWYQALGGGSTCAKT